MLRDSPIRQIMLLRHDYVHRIGRKVTMLLRIWRFAAIYLTDPPCRSIAAGLGVWFAVVSLANAQMAQWNSLPLPANWTDVWRQWECGHAASAPVDLLGFGALMLAVVVDTPRSASHAGAASESRRYDSA